MFYAHGSTKQVYGMQIFNGFTDAIYRYTYIHIHTLASPRFLIEGKILLSTFVQLKLGHFLKSLAITCYNHTSLGKLGPWRFMVASRFQRFFFECLVRGGFTEVSR